MKNIAYIDAQNVHKAIQELGWIIDWEKFYQYLQKKFGPIEIKIFFGYVQMYQSFYRKLENFGYHLVFKKVSTKVDGTIKGNVDIDIAMHVMEDMLSGQLSGGVIITGDSDFNTLIERLHREKKLLRLIVPNYQKTSKYLRIAACENIQDLSQSKHLINKETPG